MIIHTKSGVFAREEPHIGLLTYSPYSGLLYACDNNDKEIILNWLNKENDVQPNEEYIKALGAGWAIDSKDAEYPVPHLLPAKSEEWSKILYPDKPILINWLITGLCPLACQYCYAEDLMKGRYPEPDFEDVKNIANSILDYNPLAVVLTGGDPLVSPYLEMAVELLHSRTGIIIDTSAYKFNESHLELFKKFNVLVRISLDSERPNVNNKLRPVNKKFMDRNVENTVSAAVNAIRKCVEANIKVAVQSVATKVNHSDLEAMGDKLYKLGVGGWRILMIAPSKLKYKEYLDLCGDKVSKKRFDDHISKEIICKHKKDWRSNMSVQVVHNKVSNDVILVSPDGTFLTESNVSQSEDSGMVGGKVVIDIENPKQPRKELIFNLVSKHAHTKRYLNINY